MFEDYKPDVLLKIALSKVKNTGYTEEFSKKLHAIFAALYRFKDKDWANARTAENTISKIKSNYRAKHLTGPIDVNAIPNDLMRLIRILTPEEEQALLKELNDMIGLQRVKDELHKIFGMAKANRILLEKLGRVDQDMSDLTFVFEGNPGTGKTTVARLMGRILAGYGLIQNPEVKEYGKGNIVSSVKGGSVKLVNEMFDNCICRVLFIDEAYTLAEPDCKDAVDQIVQNMTLPKYRGKMAIILAGYPGDMQKLMDVNPGNERRFKYRLQFDDYTNEELTQMYKNFVTRQGMKLADGCESQILAWFKSQKRGKNFGNAGLLEKLHQEVAPRRGQRFMNATSTNDTDFYLTILPEDFPETVQAKETGISAGNTVNAALSIDLTTNPPERRVTDITMLKERATGLLKSSGGEGTGFVISIADRLVLTCSHVIEGAGSDLSFIMNCNRKFETSARVLWSNYEQDMALLQLDELPDDACYVQIDNAIDKNPQELTELILCGYPDGSAFASTPSLISGAINNYEKAHDWNDRCFDTIYANVSATHGCSGGPVVRKSDMVLIGLLQGGKEGGEIQFITDIHQLFRNINIKS